MTVSRPRWVRGRNRMASWMSGARFCRRLGQRLEAAGPEGDGQPPGPAVIIHLLHQPPQRLAPVFVRQRLPPAVKTPRAVQQWLVLAQSTGRAGAADLCQDHLV